MRELYTGIESLCGTIQSPAAGYPIESRQPSLPSNTAGITSDKAEVHTSIWKKETNR